MYTVFHLKMIPGSGFSMYCYKLGLTINLSTDMLSYKGTVNFYHFKAEAAGFERVVNAITKSVSCLHSGELHISPSIVRK